MTKKCPDCGADVTISPWAKCPRCKSTIHFKIRRGEVKKTICHPNGCNGK